MSLSSYRIVLDEDAFHPLTACPRRDRSLLLSWIKQLAFSPGVQEILWEADATGRRLEVARRGRYLVYCWADHAAKELRIVRLEKI